MAENALYTPRRFGSGVGFLELNPDVIMPAAAVPGPAGAYVVRSEPLPPREDMAPSFRRSRGVGGDLPAPASAAQAAQPSRPAPAAQAAQPGRSSLDRSTAPAGATGGSLAWRNRNPGNIRDSAYARSMGATGASGGFATFPSYEAGRRAQERLLFESKGYRDLTLTGAINRWSPPSDGNDVGDYLRKLGGDPGKRMSEYSPEERADLLDKMQRHEGWWPSPGVRRASTQPRQGSRPSQVDPAAADAARVEREGGPRMVLSPDYPATTGSTPAMPQRMVDYLGTAGYGPEDGAALRPQAQPVNAFATPGFGALADFFGGW